MDLKNLKIDLIGVGGIGGWLVQPLMTHLNHLVGKKELASVDIVVIDGDKYEQKNEDRQVFDKLGNKAQITVDRLREQFSNLMPTWKGEYVTTKNVKSLIKDGHIVLVAVDNHATRKLINEHVKTLKDIIVISGGNDGVEPHKKLDGTAGTVQVYIREDGKDKLLPLANRYHPEIGDPDDVNPGELDRSAGCQAMAPGTPQIVVTNFAMASAMFNALYAVLQNKADYDEVYVSTIRNQSRPVFRTNKQKANAGGK